ncbi:Metal homeostatis protein [Sparassis crispa]|uniref:Metal homeostatis protein n=1 Tax=Sparassis crispa TaxID=139825 RepID=A0A401GBI6_9APHY|nr:Metal homeostatis protein [Sparassis crispa]GBE79538.1 Metal homeostatis protein [Sparassis crispa]
MSARYAPLPNPHTDHDAENEMEAAFNDSDDEDAAVDPHHHPINTRNGYHPLAHDDPEPSSAHEQSAPGTYDFEAVDYDYARPPPGSPPGPSDRALPNEYGNSNGLVPSLISAGTDDAERRGGWLRRSAAAILPSYYVDRFGLVPHAPPGAIGGGTSNDGVFANVTAKPSRPLRIRDGDETYLVPEDAQKDAPPSYASAQADAVPPYWETTIHAPSSSNSPGEVIIDSLPTGSLFSFLWNMLVSISFQFVGFLLTYLLHTTHAAKLGSRAGLGITLIQYGFAMRGRDDPGESGQGSWTGWKPAQGEPPYGGNVFGNTTLSGTPTVPADNTPLIIGDATSEWLSFLLMTIGWFILLTSLLGFYRVKRWEHGILTSTRDAPPIPSDTRSRTSTMLHSLERVFGMQGLADGSLLRTGLGLPSPLPRSEDPAALAEVVLDEPSSPRGEYILPLDPEDPQRNEQIAQAFAVQARLHQDLRSAGLI